MHYTTLEKLFMILMAPAALLVLVWMIQDLRATHWEHLPPSARFVNVAFTVFYVMIMVGATVLYIALGKYEV